MQNAVQTVYQVGHKSWFLNETGPYALLGRPPLGAATVQVHPSGVPGQEGTLHCTIHHIVPANILITLRCTLHNTAPGIVLLYIVQNYHITPKIFLF